MTGTVANANVHLTGIRCPSCGAVTGEARNGGECLGCGAECGVSVNRITWPARTFDYVGARRRAILKSALNPLANPWSPLVRAVNRRIDEYYRRTLSELDLARRFAEYYLAGIPVGPETVVLDHGCGRGRLIGLLTQLGARVCAQDIWPHAWWERFPDCTFQVVSPEYRRLPWSANTFDVVLDVMVIEYLSEDGLTALASEVHRVLKEHGHWVVYASNPTGRGAHARQTPYAHTAETVEHIAERIGFEALSRRYEGVASAVLPVLGGAIQTIRKGRAFDYFAYGAPDRWRVPDRVKRAYVVALRKKRVA